MSANYAKLRGKIREVYGTQEAFAEAIGMNTVSLSQRLNGKLEWKISEIAKACEVLGIPLSENAEYFFTKKVKIS
jgi:Helix-turn-helix.